LHTGTAQEREIFLLRNKLRIKQRRGLNQVWEVNVLPFILINLHYNFRNLYGMALAMHEGCNLLV